MSEVASSLTLDEYSNINEEKESELSEVFPNYTDAVLPPCSFPEKSDFLPVEQFVTASITQRDNDPLSSSDVDGYRSILECIRSGTDPLMLWKILISLRTGPSVLYSISFHPEIHSRLVHLMLRLDPFNPPPQIKNAGEVKGERRRMSGRMKIRYDQEKEEQKEKERERELKLKYFTEFKIADAHLHLVVALISANCNFLTPGLEMLWRNLCAKGNNPKEKIERLHISIATILRQVPHGHLKLLPILLRSRPHCRLPSERINYFANQCMTLVQYAPSLRCDVLKLLIDMALDMDVEIKISDNGLVSIEKEEKEEMFDIEIEEKSIKFKCKEENVEEMAEKLDSLMLLILKHLETQSMEKIYPYFVHIFNECILTTHKSKFVQFLIFYVLGEDSKCSHASINSYLYRHFAAFLLNNILDSRKPTTLRQTCACYLASYISRANYVDAETACETVAALLRWIEAYLDTDPKFGNEKEHCLFYTVTQAVFYIMCFRSTAVMTYFRDHEEDDTAGIFNLGKERWEFVCKSALVPLRYCLESVRREFLDLAEHHQILGNDYLNELKTRKLKRRNDSKRKAATKIVIVGMIPKTKGGVGGMGVGQNPLDSFFPFDPFLLRRSSAFVDDYYNHWECAERQLPVDDEIAEDEQDEDEQDEDEQDGDSDVQSMSLTSAGSFLNPDNKMSLSPWESMKSVGGESGRGSLDRKQEWLKEIEENREKSLGDGSW